MYFLKKKKVKSKNQIFFRLYLITVEGLLMQKGEREREKERQYFIFFL